MGTSAESSVPKCLGKYYKLKHRNSARDEFPSNFKWPKLNVVRDFPLNCGASADVEGLLKMHPELKTGAESASTSTMDQGKDVPAIPDMLSLLRSMPSTDVKWDREYSPPAHSKDDIDAQILDQDDENAVGSKKCLDDEVGALDACIAQASKYLSSYDVKPSSCIDVNSTGRTDPLVQTRRKEGILRDKDEVGELDSFIALASNYLNLSDVKPSSCMDVKSTGRTDPLLQTPRQDGTVRDMNEVGELDTFIAQAIKYLSLSNVKPSSSMDVKSTGRTDPLVQTPRQEGRIRDRDEVGELVAFIAQAIKYLSLSSVKPSSCIDVKSISGADPLVQTPRQEGTVREKAVVAGSFDEVGAPKVARERTSNQERITEDNAQVDILLVSDCNMLQPSMKRKFEDF